MVVTFLGAFSLLGVTRTNFKKYLYEVDNVIMLKKHNMTSDSKTNFLNHDLHIVQKINKNLWTQNVALYYYMKVCILKFIPICHKQNFQIFLGNH